MFSRSIYYVSAPCSTGKTWTACQHIAFKRDCNWLYVAPSTELAEQTKKQLADFGVAAHVITHKTHPKNVMRSFIGYLKGPMKWAWLAMFSYPPLPHLSSLNIR